MARRVTSLALLGGAPAFPQLLHVGRPNLGDPAVLSKRIDQMVESRWLSNEGAFVREFERCIAERLGVKHCVAICNATVALELAVHALNLSGEVIVPAFTFVATAHALKWRGITPVFCDIDPSTHNIDPRQVSSLITPRTTGIVGVHLWGRPCPVQSLERIALQNNLYLLFDAAHALGCSYEGKAIGNFGSAEILSFHATKIVNAGEGGAVVTNDDALAARLRLMKNFGFSDYDTVTSLGTNGKMSELSAIMGLTNFESLDSFVAVNRENFQAYKENLAEIPGLSLIAYDSGTSPNYHYVVVEVEAGSLGLTRDELLAVLHAEGILARRYFYPGVHRMEPYRSDLKHASVAVPHTEELADRVLVLPTGTAVSTADVEMICAIIRSATEQRLAIKHARAGAIA